MTPAPVAPRFSRAVSRSIRLFALLLAGAVVATLLPFPWTLAGLPIAGAACVVALIAMIAMRGGASTGLWLSMLVGLVLSIGLALTFTTEAIFYREFSIFQDCRNNAITVGAAAECQKELEDSVNARLKDWENALRPAPAVSSSSS